MMMKKKAATIAAFSVSSVVSSFPCAYGAAAANSAPEVVERNLQNCPEPNPDTVCTTENAPVKCGSQACEYPNQCNANAAGFTPGICWPATCVAPSGDVVCTANSNPVLCGDSACPYANYCAAEAAGFPPTVCAAENCPTPPGEVACTMELDPFVCIATGIGLCGYDNSCLATQSGFDINSGQCVRKPEFIANNLGACPPVGSGGDTQICPLLYSPVRCGSEKGDCYYANECEAFSAGFDANDPFACQSTNCPVPSDGEVCTADWNPVRCYPEECTYANQCEADAAGYSPGACVTADCPAPDLAAKCTREYDPQTCTVAETGAECTYDNPCVAQSAGFTDVETSCQSQLDPVNPDTCPTPDPTVACSLEINELYCGENDCFYSNQCFATSAGFTEIECRNINCPASTATVEDCEAFGISQNLCGPYNCPYLSDCTANRAGWLPVECTPIDCPQPPPGTACSLEYDPIVCAFSNIAGGIPCPYSNSCLAGAAGYNTLETAGQCVRPFLPTTTRSAASVTTLPADTSGSSNNMTTTTDGDAATPEQLPDDTNATGTETEDDAPADGGSGADSPALESSGAVMISTATGRVGSLLAIVLIL